MQISIKQIEKFRLIIDAYQDQTIIPVEGHWKGLNNNDLWFRMIGQIMVVGSVTGKINFDARPELQKLAHVNTLKKLKEEERTLTINYVLRESKVRYASEDLNKCAKTRALANNFEVLQEFEGGMSQILNMFHLYDSKNAEWERVEFLKANFKFMKNKSARDYLMGIGMNRLTLALDVRIQNIFNYVGISFPVAQDLGNTEIYDTTERKIIEKICKPLNVEPIVFDRILFQNYTRIITGDFLIPKLF